MPKRTGPHPERVKATRYIAPDGSRCSKGDLQARKVTVQGDTYFVRLPDLQSGERRWISLKTTEIGEAWKRLNQLLKERAESEAGLANPHLVQAARPIAEHIDEWVAVVRTGDVTDKRLRMLHSRVTELARLAGWKRISEIRRPSCAEALAALQRTPTKNGTSAVMGGRSAQTRNHYLSHIRQFCRWLYQEKRLQEDPLSGLKPISVEGDRRHDRRCPRDEEVELLFAYLSGEWPQYPPLTRKGMSGEQRSLGYQLAMCTGLRANELRSLTPSSFDFASGEVRLQARKSKRRKRDTLPIPTWLAQKLEAWLASNGGLWSGFDRVRPGRLLKDDLRFSRQAWIAMAESDEEQQRRERSTLLAYEIAGNDGPLFWDFHSLRHWYITQVASQQGMSPAVMQAMARHSDPKLTLEVYAKARQSLIRQAADAICLPRRNTDKKER